MSDLVEIAKETNSGVALWIVLFVTGVGTVMRGIDSKKAAKFFTFFSSWRVRARESASMSARHEVEEMEARFQRLYDELKKDNKKINERLHVIEEKNNSLMKYTEYVAEIFYRLRLYFKSRGEDHPEEMLSYHDWKARRAQ